MAELVPNKFEQFSTFGIEVTLTDAESSIVAPAAITEISYSLVDEDGTVVNQRQNVAIAAANPATIELEPDDTDISTPVDAGKIFRVYLQVTWVYTDSVLGANSECCDEYAIQVIKKYNARAQ